MDALTLFNLNKIEIETSDVELPLPPEFWSISSTEEDLP